MDGNSQASLAEQICHKLSTYFGADYEVSSNKVDVFTIRSRLKESVYVESEDITIVNSIAEDYGLVLAKWRIVVANDQVGIYCVLSRPEQIDKHFDRGTGPLSEKRKA